MFAVIKTGGKQYVVSPDTKLKIEKIKGEVGDTVSFPDVLLFSDGSRTLVGQPAVSGASVEAKIIRQTRDEKKTVFRYHAKTRYRKLKGHRQQISEVQITSIKAK